MSKDIDNTDEKINNAITDVLRDYKKLQSTSNIQKVDGHTTIYIIPVKLLGHNGNGLYFVHPSSEIYPVNSKQKPQYSTAYVIPQDPKDPHDYTNINYIEVKKCLECVVQVQHHSILQMTFTYHHNIIIH